MSELPALRDVIRAHGLDARKSLGQHFLLDGNLTDRIARAADDLSGKVVLEVGPGPGGLTRSLLRAGPDLLHVIERDERCLGVLSELEGAYPNAMNVVADDALNIRLSELTPRPSVIVSNLPYNVGTPLLINWLRELEGVERMILMFQREVAERVCAQSGTSAYGRLAVVTQWLCDSRILFNVDKQAFTPPPNVMSAVIELVPLKTPRADAEMEKLERVTQAAFGQRRKMLRRSLKQIGLDPSDAGIDPERRAETLSVEEFCALARLL